MLEWLDFDVFVSIVLRLLFGAAIVCILIAYRISLGEKEQPSTTDEELKEKEIVEEDTINQSESEEEQEEEEQERQEEVVAEELTATKTSAIEQEEEGTRPIDTTEDSDIMYVIPPEVCASRLVHSFAGVDGTRHHVVLLCSGHPEQARVALDAWEAQMPEGVTMPIVLGHDDESSAIIVKRYTGGNVVELVCTAPGLEPEETGEELATIVSRQIGASDPVPSQVIVQARTVLDEERLIPFATSLESSLQSSSTESSVVIVLDSSMDIIRDPISYPQTVYMRALSGKGEVQAWVKDVWTKTGRETVTFRHGRELLDSLDKERRDRYYVVLSMNMAEVSVAEKVYDTCKRVRSVLIGWLLDRRSISGACSVNDARELVAALDAYSTSLSRFTLEINLMSSAHTPQEGIEHVGRERDTASGNDEVDSDDVISADLHAMCMRGLALGYDRDYEEGSTTLTIPQKWILRWEKGPIADALNDLAEHMDPRCDRHVLEYAYIRLLSLHAPRMIDYTPWFDALSMLMEHEASVPAWWATADQLFGNLQPSTAVQAHHHHHASDQDYPGEVVMPEPVASDHDEGSDGDEDEGRPVVVEEAVSEQGQGESAAPPLEEDTGIADVPGPEEVHGEGAREDEEEEEVLLTATDGEDNNSVIIAESASEGEGNAGDTTPTKEDTSEFYAATDTPGSLPPIVRVDDTLLEDSRVDDTMIGGDAAVVNDTIIEDDNTAGDEPENAFPGRTVYTEADSTIIYDNDVVIGGEEEDDDGESEEDYVSEYEESDDVFESDDDDAGSDGGEGRRVDPNLHPVAAWTASISGSPRRYIHDPAAPTRPTREGVSRRGVRESATQVSPLPASPPRVSTSRAMTTQTTPAESPVRRSPLRAHHTLSSSPGADRQPPPSSHLGAVPVESADLVPNLHSPPRTEQQSVQFRKSPTRQPRTGAHPARGGYTGRRDDASWGPGRGAPSLNATWLSRSNRDTHHGSTAAGQTDFPQFMSPIMNASSRFEDASRINGSTARQPGEKSLLVRDSMLEGDGDSMTDDTESDVLGVGHVTTQVVDHTTQTVHRDHRSRGGRKVSPTKRRRGKKSGKTGGTASPSASTLNHSAWNNSTNTEALQNERKREAKTPRRRIGGKRLSKNALNRSVSRLSAIPPDSTIGQRKADLDLSRELSESSLMTSADITRGEKRGKREWRMKKGGIPDEPKPLPPVDDWVPFAPDRSPMKAGGEGRRVRQQRRKAREDMSRLANVLQGLDRAQNALSSLQRHIQPGTSPRIERTALRARPPPSLGSTTTDTSSHHTDPRFATPAAVTTGADDRPPRRALSHHPNHHSSTRSSILMGGLVSQGIVSNYHSQDTGGHAPLSASSIVFQDGEELMGGGVTPGPVNNRPRSSMPDLQ